MVDETEFGQSPMSVHNKLTGKVLSGSVIQAGTINQMVLRPEPQDELPVPRQLPPAVADFAGRDDQLAELDVLLDRSENRPAATVISALDGTAGVGKTTLAVQWAHRVEHRFTDGTLFANLRGYGPSSPVDPNQVLSSFINVFGIREERIPAGLDAQVGLYRSLLADRRVLILLDNASTAEQVRPLLPGSRGCLVLITSRGNLSGLAVAEAASRLTLGLFTPEEADALVGTIIGAGRVAAEPRAVADLIHACARLPLALRIAASRIAGRPHVSIAEVVADILEDRSRLDMLSRGGDERSAVRSVFDWSYDQLPAGQAALFRRLGLHPGMEFSAAAAAAVGDLEVPAAHRQLEELADAHMIEAIGARRYRFHDLLHGYAGYRAEREETAEDRRVATTRLFAWYAQTARAADQAVYPGLESLDIDVGRAGTDVSFSSRSEALAWLNTERANLLSALRAALRHEAHDIVLSLAATARFLRLRERSLWPVRLEAETLGLRAARASLNRPAEAFLLGFRGDTLTDLGQLGEAEADFELQLALAEELGDAVRHRVAVNGLGQIRLRQQRYSEALRYYSLALSLAREAGGGRPEAVVECNLSRICVHLGQYQEALHHAECELELRRHTADRVGEAYALHDVAVARQHLADHEGAIGFAEQAIAMYRKLEGTGGLLAVALETAAASLEQTDEQERAARHLAEAAALLDELADPRAGSVRAHAQALNPD